MHSAARPQSGIALFKRAGKSHAHSHTQPVPGAWLGSDLREERLRLRQQVQGKAVGQVVAWLQAWRRVPPACEEREQHLHAHVLRHHVAHAAVAEARRDERREQDLHTARAELCAGRKC